jgi:hypothetical protein
MRLFVLRSKSHILRWMLYAMAIISITWWSGCRSQNNMSIQNTESGIPPDKYQVISDTFKDIVINNDTINKKQNEKPNPGDSNKRMVNVKKDTVISRLKDSLKSIKPIHPPVCEYGVKPNYR